jgi:hypothetical protein
VEALHAMIDSSVLARLVHEAPGGNPSIRLTRMKIMGAVHRRSHQSANGRSLFWTVPLRTKHPGNTMAVFEGWTFAAARGASCKSLVDAAQEAWVGAAVLDDVERAGDINPATRHFDMADIERIVEFYHKLGYRIMPRRLIGRAALKRFE